MIAWVGMGESACYRTWFVSRVVGFLPRLKSRVSALNLYDVGYILSVVATGSHLSDPLVLGSFEQFAGIVGNVATFGSCNMIGQPPLSGL